MDGSGVLPGHGLSRGALIFGGVEDVSPSVAAPLVAKFGLVDLAQAILTGGFRRDSLIADAVESIIGAMFIDTIYCLDYFKIFSFYFPGCFFSYNT